MNHYVSYPQVRYKQRLELRLASKRSHRSMLRTPSARRSRRSTRSGYAFAHQEGFGRLITSGKIMMPNPRQAAVGVSSLLQLRPTHGPAPGNVAGVEGGVTLTGGQWQRTNSTLTRIGEVPGGCFV